MKKKLTIVLLLAVHICAGAILTGCGGGDGGDTPPPPPPADIDVTVDADIAAIQARAAWNEVDNKTVWGTGDAIGVFVGSDSNVKLALGEDGKFAGKLTAEPASTADYYGYYPYAAASALNGTELTVTLPATQQYKQGGFAAMPMVAAYNGSLGDVKMTFQHPFGVLKVSAVMEDGVGQAGVTSLKVIGNASETLAGTADIDLQSVNNSMTATAPIAVAFSDAIKTVTLNCASAVTVTDATPADFYVVVPAGEYAKGLTFTFATASGNMEAKYESTVTVARGSISSVEVTLGDPLPPTDEEIEFVAKSPVLSGYTYVPGGALNNGKGRMIWVANEAMGFFSSGNDNVQLAQVGGSMNADKTEASYEGEVAAITAGETVYAYAPYDADAAIAQNKLTLVIPAEQQYMAEGNASLPVVAAYKGSPNGKNVDFHNLLGTICIRTNLEEGSVPAKIKSVRIETATGEKIAGTMLVDLSGVADMTDPAAVITTTMLAGSYILNLDCGDGVLVEAGVPTDFHFAVPPVVMPVFGFYIFWELEDGSKFEWFHSLPTEIRRDSFMVVETLLDNREGSKQTIGGRPGGVTFDKDENVHNI